MKVTRLSDKPKHRRQPPFTVKTVTQISQHLCILTGALALPLSGCKTTQSSVDNRGEVYVAGASQRGNGSTAAPRPPAAAGYAPKESYSKVQTSLPFVALTFDDGPHPSNTPRLLDILKARDVKATFFVVGTNVKRYPNIMRRIIAEGHEIGNHTVSHGNMTKMSSAQIERELTTAHQSIQAATGVAPRIMRPPYGAITSSQKSWIKQKWGYPSIMWSVDPQDWKKPGASVVTSRLVNGAKPGGILLVHDIHSPSIDAMPGTIDQILRKGLQFVTVSQLIALDGKG